MGMSSDAILGASAVINPIDTAIGYGVGAVSKALDIGSNIFTPWLTTFSDIGVAAGEGTDVANAAMNGISEDVKIGGSALSGAVAGGPIAAAAAAGTTQFGMTVENLGGNIGSDELVWTGKGIQLLPGAVAGGAGIYNWASSLGAEAAAAGTSAASTAASAAAESAPDVFEAGLSSVHHMGFSEADAAQGLTEAARNAKSGEVVNDLAKSVSAAGAGAGGGGGGAASGLSFSDMMTFGGWGVKAAGIGWGLYSGLKGADAIRAEADAKADAEEQQAGIDEENAKLTELSAENYDLRNAALEKAGDYEKEALLKRRRQIAGQSRAAAAANGVMLEGRAESSPSMFEQDVASEAAYEVGKIATDVRTKQAFNDINRALTMAKAANQRYGAGVRRYNAGVTRSLGNLRSSSERLNAWAGAGLGAAELGFGIAGSNTVKSLFA